MSAQSDSNSSVDLEINDSINEADQSQSSDNLSKSWPSTLYTTSKVIKDATIDIKKFQLERDEAEMQAENMEREFTLQNEIREITSEITRLRTDANNYEIELNNIKDQQTTEIIQLEKETQTKLLKFKSILSKDESLIEQLESAIEAQRANHERNKEMINSQIDGTVVALDEQIKQLTSETNKIRTRSITAAHKAELNASDANLLIDTIKTEINSIYNEINTITQDHQDLSVNLSSLKRELIIYEEMGESLRTQIDQCSQSRSRIKGIFDRARMSQWMSQNHK